MNFKVDESTSYKNHYRIFIQEAVHNKINTPINTTYNILYSRLFGLEFADFCRFVRDKYNASLHGRQGGYITFTFKNKKDAKEFAKEIENRWKKFIE